MAITQVYYHILRQARLEGILPQGGSILELGEANWYGDFPVESIQQDLETFVTVPDRRAALINLLNDRDNPIYIFNVAKVIYGMFFAPDRVVSIDLHGTEAAKPLDLNTKIDLEAKFAVTINNGTAEHVFNIGQFFETMHNHTAEGGIMIHEAPFTGWFNHGFFNLQPTLYYDLAAANDYAMTGLFCCQHKPAAIRQIDTPHALLEAVKANQIPENSVLITLFRKTTDQPFVFPMQGYYAGTLDAEQQEAWHSLRKSETT